MKGAKLSAQMAIGNFIVANEEGLDSVVKGKGVQMIKPDADFEKVVTEYRRSRRSSGKSLA